jgi:hypothetical protein
VRGCWRGLRLGPGEALPEYGLLGRVTGQVEGAAIRGTGLVGIAHLTQELGAGRVVQVVFAEALGQVIQLGHRAARPVA